MKLFYVGVSPYARKVRVVADEKGLGDRIEEIEVNPYERPADLVAANPIGKIPCLVLEDGTAYYDSPVICEYLDSLNDNPKLLPDPGPERFQALRRLALTDGILDQAFNISCEVNRRPENERSPHWIEHWKTAVAAAITALDSEIGDYGDRLTLAHIGAGVALGYADFRLGEMLDWRADNPALAEWYAEFSRRASMRATAPGA